MTIPVLQFVSKDWVTLGSSPTHVTIDLLAYPPVGAALKATIYVKPIGPDGWSIMGSSVIDNLAYTAAAPSMTFAVSVGNYYAVKLQGEAHLLMPGYNTVDVKIGVRVNGVPVDACPQPDPAAGNVAGLVGMLYFQAGE